MRIRLTFVTALVLSIQCLASSAIGRDIVVPGDSPDLDRALRTADRGDRILLRAGRHDGSLLDLVAGVSIIGNLEDPGSVIIDAGGQARVFRAEGIGNVRIEGVTIVGGRAQGFTSYSASGGGLFVSSSRVDLKSVYFVNNTADAAGGCIRVSNGEVVIEDCRFIEGSAAKGGGAIDLSYDSTAQIRRSTFRGNRAAWGGAVSARTGSSCWIDDSVFEDNVTIAPQELGGAFFADFAAQVVFRGCVLSGNAARQGGAARLGDAISSFTSCTIAENSAWESGGGLMVRGGSLHLDHAIVAFNDGSAVAIDDGLVFVTATDIFGNLGGDWVEEIATLRNGHDNLEADPLFCSVDDLHLQDDSPCAPQNSPVGLIGALEVECSEVGIQLDRFRAAQNDDEILLTWQVHDGERFEYRLRGWSEGKPDAPSWLVEYTADELPGHFRALDKPADTYGTLRYTLEAREPADEWTLLGEVTVNVTTFIPPAPLVIDRVYPNPFNPQVTIQYTLNEPGMVEASIYDIKGRIVFPITRSARRAGTFTVRWDGIGEHGREAPAGTYILRIVAAGQVVTRKLVMVR